MPLVKIFLFTKPPVSRTDSLKTCAHTDEQKMFPNKFRYYTLLWVFSKILIVCSRIVPALSLEQSQKNMNQGQEKNLLCKYPWNLNFCFNFGQN